MTDHPTPPNDLPVPTGPGLRLAHVQQTIDNVDRALGVVAKELKEVATNNRVNRRWLKVTGGVIVILALVTALSIYSVVKIHASTVEACRRDNRQSGLTSSVLLQLINIPSPTPRTPEQEAGFKQARTIITDGFAPHSC